MLQIDVISDVVCPWCFVGKRQLDYALEQWAQDHPEHPVQVQWHPYQLNPDMPASGLAREVYLQRKFGKTDPSELFNQVNQAAMDVGVRLNLAAIARQPNTVKAHALVALAEPRQAEMQQVLFEAYFQQGADLTEDDTLRDLGLRAGLSQGLIDAALGDQPLHEDIQSEDTYWREQGVSGVPFFIIDQRIAIPGAAGAAVLLAALEKVTQQGSQASE
jgi:predicted DsbA family dithiol-disulfide isomerase